MRKNGSIGAIALVIIIFGGAILGFSCTSRVPIGYVGIIYNMNGGVDGEVLSQGWHLVAPTKKVTTYSTGLEQSYLTSEEKGDPPNDESFSTPTFDGKTVRVNLELSCRSDEERAAETFTIFKGKSGEQIKDIFIKPKIITWTQEVSTNYPVTGILGDKRVEINAELDAYSHDKFDKHDIIIDTANFTDISVDDETAAAIQKKATAQQELELANIEAQTVKIQTEKDRQVAEINVRKQVTNANAKAEVTCTEVEAGAQANREIAASLTPNLTEKIKYECWNGELLTISGSGATVGIDGID